MRKLIVTAVIGVISIVVFIGMILNSQVNEEMLKNEILTDTIQPVDTTPNAIVIKKPQGIVRKNKKIIPTRPLETINAAMECLRQEVLKYRNEASDSFHRISDKRVIEAIHLCATKKHVESLPILLNLIDEIDSTQYQEKEWYEQLKCSSAEYPVSNAIASFGNLSIPFIIEGLALENDHCSLRASILRETLVIVAGVEKANEYIRAKENDLPHAQSERYPQ